MLASHGVKTTLGNRYLCVNSRVYTRARTEGGGEQWACPSASLTSEPRRIVVLYRLPHYRPKGPGCWELLMAMLSGSGLGVSTAGCDMLVSAPGAVTLRSQLSGSGLRQRDADEGLAGDKSVELGRDVAETDRWGSPHWQGQDLLQATGVGP